MIFLGLDPGASGSIAALNGQGEVVSVIRNKETLHDQAAWLADRGAVMLAAIEQVNAMPKQGVSSTFKFGRSFGQLEGMLAAVGIPYELVRPAAWQKAMQCRTRGDKNVTKAAAQRLWPDRRIVHAEADALLLAEWVRRLWHSRNGRVAAAPVREEEIPF